MATEIVILRN